MKKIAVVMIVVAALLAGWNALAAGQQVYDYAETLKAAESGDAEAQFILGQSFYYGKGVERNEEIGVQWWKHAAIGGHARAQGILGSMHLLGRGVIRDKKLAAGCCELLPNREIEERLTCLMTRALLDLDG